ncbi:MAG: hypothetical protein MdMp014T_2118 [Treponematales bacterium]
MHAIEFNANIQDGKITVPFQYRRACLPFVRVTLVQGEVEVNTRRKAVPDKISPPRVYPETPEEAAFKKTLNPATQREMLENFFKEWDAVPNEPLGEDFDKALLGEWKFGEAAV